MCTFKEWHPTVSFPQLLSYHHVNFLPLWMTILGTLYKWKYIYYMCILGLVYESSHWDFFDTMNNVFMNIGKQTSASSSFFQLFLGVWQGEQCFLQHKNFYSNVDAWIISHFPSNENSNFNLTLEIYVKLILNVYFNFKSKKYIKHFKKILHFEVL